MFQRISPDFYCYRSTCNSYVIVDGKSAVVFDIGDGSVLDHLPSIGIEKVEWIFCTSHHRELCQGLERINKNKIDIAVPEIELELFEAPLQFRKWNPKLSDKYSVYGASYVRPCRTPTRIKKVLNDKQIVSWKNWSFQCIQTPGHSPGGMSYRIEKNGESFVISGGIIYDGARLTNWFDSEWDYGFGKGLDALIASVERLAKEKPDRLFPSQGTTIADAQSQLESYLKRLREFKSLFVRGYQVFDAPVKDRDPVSQETPVPLINRVTPHLYKLNPKNNPGKNFAIIVSDDGKGLVLDAGLFPEKTLDQIILGIREHLGLKSIDAFWISHMHGDHFLLGPTLKKRYGAAAWTLDRIADKCEHPRRYDYAAMVSAYSDGFDGMSIDKKFRDGETINWEGYKIQVDWMPGQTEFGCCLWLEIDGKKIAFTGDNLFGNPAKPQDNGHEALVARNSAILEEGYLFGSQYLKDLKPDLIIGSHSYVMQNPHEFIDRYHAWSKEMISTLQNLLPDNDYEYLFDPYWVSAYPYRVDLSKQTTKQITVTVRNFRDRPQRHHIELILPKGIHAEPAILDGLVARHSRQSYKIKLTVERNAVATGMHIVPFDIRLDEKHYGQWFDFMIRTDSDR